jgi:putative peptidoglycan lipid II flippase
MDASADRSFSLRDISRSAVILTAGAGAAQLVGIVREVYLAARVGVSADLDALLIVLVLPATLAGVLTSGAMTALVPTYADLRPGSGGPAASRFAGGLLAWTALAGLVLGALIAIAADGIVAVLGPGLSAAGREASAGYLRLLAPVGFVAALAAHLQAVCQAQERFRGMARAHVAAPAITVTAMVVLWDRLGLTSVVVGTLLGTFVAAALLFVATVPGDGMPRLTLRLPRSEVRAFVRHAAPLTLSSGILQLNAIADRAIASLLLPGAVSALRFAEILVRAPIGMIAPAWGNAIYPALVGLTQRGSRDELGGATGRAAGYAIAVFAPVAALTAAVAPIAVAVAFLRGAFDSADLALTAPVVAAFAPLIVVLMVSPVLTSALNARRRGGVLLAGGVLNVVLNLVLDVALGSTIGVAGIALSSSLASTVVLLLFARRIAATEPGFGPQAILRTLVRASLAATLVAAAVAVLAWSGWLPADVRVGLAALVVVGVLGSAAYAALAGWVLGVTEVRTVLRSAVTVVTGWLRREPAPGR